jgi:hypothetical protein
MDQSTMSQIALRSLKEHETDYGVKVHERVRAFFESGEAWKYDRRCLPPGTELPMMEPGSFRLCVTNPSWMAHTWSGLDDAVVGSSGDWESAKEFIPVFVVDQSKFIVVRHRDGAVGWFEEEIWQMNRDGYEDGVFLLGDSLDELLARLVELEQADWETERDAEAWQYEG